MTQDEAVILAASGHSPFKLGAGNPVEEPAQLWESLTSQFPMLPWPLMKILRET